MALTQAQLLNFLISYTANFQSVSPLNLTMPTKVPVTFSGVQNLNVLTGTFTPANNQKTIVSGLASSIAPNFIFLLVDQPIVFSADNNMLSEAAISQLLFMCCPDIASGGNPWSSFTIDGRTNVPYPMQQGTAVNYTFLYGQATISRS